MMICLTIAGITGCSGGAEKDIASAVSGLRGAFHSEDYRQVCAQLTRAAKVELGGIGHGDATRCDADMQLHMPAGVLSAADLVEPELRQIDVGGDEATAFASFGGGVSVGLRFTRDDGEWKLAHMFNSTSSRQELSTRPTGAPIRTVVVSARTRRGEIPCRELRVERTKVTGGCLLKAKTANQRTTVLNVFGDHRLANCLFEYDMRIGPAGEIAIDETATWPHPSQTNAACTDIDPCSGGDGKVRPWLGRLSASAAADRLAVTFDSLCFDTCLGRFDGPASLELIRGERGLRLKADASVVGTTGFTVSGEWALSPPGGGSVEIAEED